MKCAGTYFQDSCIPYRKINCLLVFCLGPHLSGMPGSTVGPCPVARMYGITMEGNSVLCHIHGFVPYFFVPAPSNMMKDDCHAFQDSLNKAVLQDMRSNKDNISQVKGALCCMYMVRFTDR